MFLESEVTMKLPYVYVLSDRKIVIHEEKADVIRSIFEYYLAEASLGKVVVVKNHLGDEPLFIFGKLSFNLQSRRISTKKDY